MYLIALCDDESAELDKTEKMLEKYGRMHTEVNFLVERFESAAELLYKVREKDYRPDLILMDIYMPKKMGTEAAKELRRLGNTARIVFLTTSREHALEAFRVDALQYLVKPVPEDALSAILDRLLTDVEEEKKKFLLFRVEGRMQRVAKSSIMYCEAQGKTQYLFLADGTKYQLRMTMAEIFGMLSRYQEFVRVGIAYIVNMEHIDSINTQEIGLHTGKKIYLPRGACKALKEQYMRYYCEES